VAGLVHAGWRGTHLGVVQNAVDLMAGAFLTHRDRIMAFLGPSIGPCCYRVGEDVAGRFESRFVQEGNLDLWSCNREQLIRSGVPAGRIGISGLCTSCYNHYFFSHRAEKGRTGRQMAFLGWRR
jgi:copper oxidase (laccase) domain-containing protein